MDDDAQRGRAHAGHVEILLASWYALEMVRRATGASGSAASVEWLLSRLHRVKTATNLGAARCAIIMIDHQPCATCLKFINHLYQYTGVYFAVQGSVGVGPTIVTKDPRNNLRLDTFGDVFAPEDGEDADTDMDVDEGDDEGDGVVVPETPAAALARNAATARGGAHALETIESPTDDTPPAEQTTPGPRPLPWMTDPRQRTPSSDSDSGIDDISHAARVVMEQIARPHLHPPHPTTPLTATRAPMAWPPPNAGAGSSSRRGRREDPFSNMPPSRVPANHLELVADYKKKTPVWQWPGYEAVAQMRSEDLRRRLAEATPCPGGEGADTELVEDTIEDVGRDMGEDIDVGMGVGAGADAGASDEDMIIVDQPDDSDDADAAAYSPGSGHSPAHQSIMSKMNSQPNEREEDPEDSPLKNPKVFLYSSFVPIPRSSRSDDGSSMLQSSMASQPRFHMQDNHVDNGNEDAEEDDFYMIRPSQRARLGDCTMDEDADEEVDMVSAHFPPARPVSFSQFKYQPRARHGRVIGKGKAPEAPMFQPRPIPGFRGLHRLGR